MSSNSNNIVSGEFVLPASGLTIIISDRELTGRDREQADLIRQQRSGSAFAFFHALLACVLSIKLPDGTTRQLVPEDVSDMSTRDLDVIIALLDNDPRFPSEDDRKNAVAGMK